MLTGRDYGDETPEHPVEDAFDLPPLDAKAPDALLGPWGRFVRVNLRNGRADVCPIRDTEG